MSAETRPEDVLHFWLGAPGDPPLRNAERWFAVDAAFDAELRERFGATLEAACRGELQEWRRTPRGRLALVIVLDQFSRNAFRGTPRAFAQDTRAREIVVEAMAAGDDRLFGPIERSFLLLPLMHAEDANCQHRCVAAFNRLCDEAPAELKSFFERSLDYAERHEEIIERFGRFPHRNAILGRPSTKEETAFLTQPGSSF